MQWLYLAGFILGTVLPLSQLFPFVVENGLDVPLLFRQLFANHAGGFFGLDVMASSVVLWLFVCAEGRRLRMRHLWAYIACNLLVGVSSALPLFLFFRQRKMDAE